MNTLEHIVDVIPQTKPGRGKWIRKKDPNQKEKRRLYCNEYKRRKYRENPELTKELRRTKYKQDMMNLEYRLKRRKLVRNSRLRVRNAIFKLLGSKCCKCGFDDIRVLQIDHVNGGGTKERRTFGTNGSGWEGAYYNNILNKILAGSNGYQILCANCNWIKRFDKEEDLKRFEYNQQLL